jgi:hypothetical protein
VEKKNMVEKAVILLDHIPSLLFHLKPSSPGRDAN